MLLKAKSSSDDDGDDDEPLSSYRASRPSSVQEKLQTEEQVLAQYKAGRDARIRTNNGGKQVNTASCKPQQNQPTEYENAKAKEVTKNPPAAVLESHDEENVQLLEQLQAEKKKREVLHAEKVIAETKHKTLQKLLEEERKELLLLKNKIATSEAEKMELTEALDAAKKKNEMHEQV